MTDLTEEYVAGYLAAISLATIRIRGYEGHLIDCALGELAVMAGRGPEKPDDPTAAA